MRRFKDKRKVISLSLVGIAYLLIVIPLIVSNLQKQQTLHSHAQSPQSSTVTAQSTCGGATSNTMMIIDRSGSMSDKDGTSTKIANAILAGNNFVDLTAKNEANEIGLVSFSNTATTDSPLTSNFSSVKAQVSKLKASGTTCIQCAIDAADKAITAGKRSNVKNVMVLLTDGIANYVEGNPNQVSQSVAESAALTAAINSHKKNDTIIFAIGVGADVHKSFLQKLATSTGGQYYFPPTSQNLNDIYTKISQIIAQGSVSGTVFNDANKNGKLDPGEQPLAEWQVQITPQGSSTPQTVTTDNNGAFMIPGLCNGTYTLKEVTKPGWLETVPTEPNSYTINITTGNSFTDKNFGNVVAPTPTPTPPVTSMLMTVFLDGIGSRGDNTNPTKSSLSNKHPLHTTISAGTQIFTLNNQLVAVGAGTLKYNPTIGGYTGNVPISKGFPTGQYIIKLKTNAHLRKQLPLVQNITAGKVNPISTVALVAGDIDNNNVINILDYNLLLGCYSDLTAAPDCPNQQVKTNADLNDDGAVNQIDYNLFIRELSTQPGQ